MSAPMPRSLSSICVSGTTISVRRLAWTILVNSARCESKASERFLAAAWDDAPLDAHQWSVAMRTLGVATPLESLLSPQGFLAANSRAENGLVT